MRSVKTDEERYEIPELFGTEHFQQVCILRSYIQNEIMSSLRVGQSVEGGTPDFILFWLRPLY
jgi:hypothetical protein